MSETFQAACETCGDTFYRTPDDYWKKICFPCWKLLKNINEPGKEKKEKPKEKKKAEPKQQPFFSFDPEMLKRLIYLCHPDKHNNSVASTTATNYLLKLRK